MWRLWRPLLCLVELHPLVLLAVRTTENAARSRSGWAAFALRICAYVRRLPGFSFSMAYEKTGRPKDTTAASPRGMCRCVSHEVCHNMSLLLAWLMIGSGLQ